MKVIAKKCLIALVAVRGLLIVPLVQAQALVSPSPHFGAWMFPEIEPVSRLGVNFDRFTRFGKEVDASGKYVWVPYNDVDETVGLNLLGYSYTSRVPWFRATLLRVTAQVGYGDNEPTKWGQNTIHANKHPPLRQVPDSATRSAFDAGLALDLTRWISPTAMPALPLFFGGGASLSTMYSEAFVHAGIRPSSWQLWSIPLPRPAVMGRVGASTGGDAFPRETLERTYASLQYSLTLPIGEWLHSTFLPEFEYIRSRDNGFFRGSSGQRLGEYFESWRLSFYHGLVVGETWNDSINNKDKGPTGGVRIYVQPKLIPWLDRLP